MYWHCGHANPGKVGPVPAFLFSSRLVQEKNNEATNCCGNISHSHGRAGAQPESQQQRRHGPGEPDPEIEKPGHAAGLFSLEGVRFELTVALRQRQISSLLL